MIGNLFNIASGALSSSIGRDIILYKKFISNTTNGVGMLIPSYEDAIEIDGSFQAVSSSLYSQRGLDINKHYRMLYTNTEITAIDTNTSSDRLEFNGDVYQVLGGKEDWDTYNGWSGVLCVRL